MADSFGAQFRLSSCLPFQRLRGGSAALTQRCSSQAGQLGPNLSAFTANSAQEGQVPGGTDRRPSARTRVRNTKGRKRWASPDLHNTQLQGVCRRRSLTTIAGARKPRHLVNVEVAAIARREQPHTPPRSQVTPSCGVSLPARPVAAYFVSKLFPSASPRPRNSADGGRRQRPVPAPSGADTCRVRRPLLGLNPRCLLRRRAAPASRPCLAGVVPTLRLPPFKLHSGQRLRAEEEDKFLSALKPSRHPARLQRPFRTAAAAAGHSVPQPRPLRLRSLQPAALPAALPPSDPSAARRCEARTERWEN